MKNNSNAMTPTFRTPTFRIHRLIIQNLLRLAACTKPAPIYLPNDLLKEALKDAGMTYAVRGPGGGYKMAKPVSGITLHDVDRLVSSFSDDVAIGDSPIDMAIAQALRLPDVTLQNLLERGSQGAEVQSPISQTFAPHYLGTQEQMAMRVRPTRITQNFVMESPVTPTFRLHYLIIKNLVRMAMSTKPVQIQGWSQWGGCGIWAAMLKNAGMLTPFRGRGGGYMLAIPASEITLNDVDRVASQNRRKRTLDVGDSPIDVAIAQALRLPDVTIQDLAEPFMMRPKEERCTTIRWREREGASLGVPGNC
jgi:DNA-binding IscR family transcriptional regulator